ncbi:TraB/GumN family protein [Paenibacillus hodogayensis]|uniref:TraB/GumN family protein n=1 Tax=Paenibacillus hodogayensis TaxID=279208 RepID=A0ABV5W7A6_9BACL
MAEKIKSYLNTNKKETYLIALGASHISGDSGLVTLLEKEGFKVVKQKHLAASFITLQG